MWGPIASRFVFLSLKKNKNKKTTMNTQGWFLVDKHRCCVEGCVLSLPRKAGVSPSWSGTPWGHWCSWWGLQTVDVEGEDKLGGSCRLLSAAQFSLENLHPRATNFHTRINVQSHRCPRINGTNHVGCQPSSLRSESSSCPRDTALPLHSPPRVTPQAE